MEMSSNQTMSLAGVALASESADCGTGAGKLLRIIEVITDRKWHDNVVELIVDEDSMVAGQKPVVYGLNKDGSLVKADNKDLIYRTSATGNYTRMTESFTFTEGTFYINIFNGKDLTSGKLPTDDTVVIG